eukprot:685527-Amorphochlora_amoeboformis.AAC.2
MYSSRRGEGEEKEKISRRDVEDDVKEIPPEEERRGGERRGEREERMRGGEKRNSEERGRGERKKMPEG